VATDKEQILVSLALDNESVKKADAKIKAFRDNVTSYLKSIPVRIGLKDLITSMANVKFMLKSMTKDLTDTTTIAIKVVVDQKSLGKSLATIKSFAATANAALNIRPVIGPAVVGAAPAATAAAVAAGGQRRAPPPTGGQRRAPPPTGGQKLAGDPAQFNNTASAAVTATKSVKKLGKSLDITTQSYFGFVAAQQTGRAITDPLIKSYAEFEDRLLRVGRILGLSGEELARFGDRMSRVATSLGVSRVALLELAAAAARVGVGKKDIESFVKQTQKVAIALELSGVEAATAFKSFQLLFKLDTSELTAVANVFNKVADSSAVSAQGLVGFLQYLGPVANQFDILGQKGVSAMTSIGALLAEMGVSAEIAGSGMTRIFGTLVNNMDKAARVAGVSVEEFKQVMAVDMVAALKLVLTGYQKMDLQQKQVAKSMLRLGNIRVARVFSLLANNVDKLSDKQAIANAAFKDGISVETEVAKQLGSLTSQYQQTLNSIEAVAQKGLVPLVAIIKDTMYQIREWIAANPVLAEQLSKYIVFAGALVGGFGTLAVALFGILQMVITFTNVGRALIPVIVNLTSAIWNFNLATAAAQTTGFIGWINRLRAAIATLAAGSAGVAASSVWVVGFSAALALLGKVAAAIPVILFKFVAIPLAVIAALDQLVAAFRGTKSYAEQFFEYLFTVKAPARTAEELAEAAKQTENLGKEFSKADNEAAKLTKTMDKLDNAIKTIGDAKQAQALAAKLRSAVAATQDAPLVKGKGFAEALGPDLLKKFAALVANGAQPLKIELESMVHILRTTLPDGAAVAAKKLTDIAKSIDATINRVTIQGLNEKFKKLGKKERAQKIALNYVPSDFGEITKDLDLTKIGAKELEEIFKRLTTAISSAAEQAKNFSGDQQEAALIDLAGVSAKIVEEGKGSTPKFRQQILELTSAFNGSAEAAAEFLGVLAQTNVQFNTAQATGFANVLKNFGGDAERGLVLFKALAKGVIEFNDDVGTEIVKQFGESSRHLASLVTGVKTEAELMGRAVQKGFNNIDFTKIASVVKTLTRRNGLERELVDLRAVYNELLDKGEGKIKKDIKNVLKLKRATKEVIEQNGFATTVQLESLKIQDELLAIYDEQLKKKQKSAEEARREESIANKINEYMLRSVELSDKFATANEESAAAIDKAVHKEEEHLRVLLQKITKAEDFVRVTIAGERNIQLARAATARAQAKTARKSLETANDKIRGLRESGDEKLRGLGAEARPALSPVVGAREELQKLVEAAQKGEFAHRNAGEVSLEFQKKIDRLRDLALEENQRKSLDFVKQRYDAEADLLKAQEAQRDQQFADKRFERELKNELDAARKGGDKEPELRALADRRRREREEARINVDLERRRAAQELEKVKREGSRFFSTGPNIKNDLEAVFNEMKDAFAKGLEEGAAKEDELRREALAASQSLHAAGNALQLAAAALLASADPKAQQERVEKEFGEKKTKKEGKLVELKSSSKDAANISKEITESARRAVTGLMDKFASAPKDATQGKLFEKAKSEIAESLLKQIEDASKKSGVDFGSEMTAAINDLLSVIPRNVSSKNMSSAVTAKLDAISEIGTGVVDNINQEAEVLGKELETFGEKHAEMMKLITKDTEDKRKLIEKIIDEVNKVSSDPTKVTPSSGTQQAGAKAAEAKAAEKIRRTSMDSVPDLKEPTAAQLAAEKARLDASTKPRNKGTQTLLGAQEFDKKKGAFVGSSFNNDNRDAIAKATEAGMLEAMRKRDVSRAFGIDAKAAGQDPDRPIDPKQVYTFENGRLVAQGRPVSAPAVAPAPTPSKASRQEDLSIVPRQDEASSQKLLDLPPTLVAATSFLRTLALFDGKTTAAEESVRLFGITIDKLGEAIDRRDEQVKLEQDKKSLTSINAEEVAKRKAAADDIQAEKDSIEIAKRIEEREWQDKLRQGQEQREKEGPGVSERLQEDLQKLEEFNEKTIEDGSIVIEAVEQAEEHIDALAETQEKHTDALTGLTDSLAGYATAAATATAKNTIALRETKADLAAATALLNSLAT